MTTPTMSGVRPHRRAADLRHERLVAHLDALVAGAADPVARSALAAVRSVTARHFPWDIYTECDCEPGHQDEDEDGGIVDVCEVGLVCEQGFLYSICAECCSNETPWERSQREECADGHDHVGDRAICQTLTGIEGALGLGALDDELNPGGDSG